MEFYPAELATPPLALVALLGLPDLHSKIGNYLRSNHRPPINSISVPEPSGAGRIFGERKPLLTSGVSALGILKLVLTGLIASMLVQQNGLSSSASGALELQLYCLREVTKKLYY
ncbi:hypothetical protein WJX84_004539 [Apatococcus fuscideae]|uniref:Uncharacterized protein n=1 Tax=Apatococcus fuscideae TaxID=2026836 RepID=A0AAW1SWM0_9CHLO